ncbi:hypothetical protein [Streptomyces cyaneofuscatus]|uniref:hypothetical protein n=1 Tax=Streptomyces cyaneofuscatus TaxID=66883 RepID=UPI003647A592
MPVKRLLQGAGLHQVAGRDAVDGIAALRYFTRFARPSTAMGPSAPASAPQPPSP